MKDKLSCVQSFPAVLPCGESIDHDDLPRFVQIIDIVIVDRRAPLQESAAVHIAYEQIIYGTGAVVASVHTLPAFGVFPIAGLRQRLFPELIIAVKIFVIQVE